MGAEELIFLDRQAFTARSGNAACASDQSRCFRNLFQLCVQTVMSQLIIVIH